VQDEYTRAFGNMKVDYRNTISSTEGLEASYQRDPDLRRLYVGGFLNGSDTVDLSIVTRFRDLEVLSITAYRKNELPEALPNLTNLDSLYISLDGVELVPAIIGQLKSLRHLSVRGSDLRGFEKGALDLPHLRSLDVGYCNSGFKFPSEFGQLSMLRTLVVTGVDSIPKSVSKLKSLRNLSLRNFEVLPADIEYPQDLQYLRISGCDRPLIMNIEYLKRLKMLKVSHCDTGDFVLGSALDSLKYIRLRNLESVPRELNELGSLQILDIERTDLSTFKSSVCGCEQLQDLSVMNCTNFKKIPNCLKDLPNLLQLHLSGNGINQIPKSLFESNSIKFVNYNQEDSLLLREEDLLSKKIYFTDLETRNFQK